MKIRIIPPPKKELEQAYLIERIGSAKLAKRYGCTRQTVVRWLRQYAIEVNPRGGRPPLHPTTQQRMAQNRQRAVCNTLKKHAEDLEDDPERLSTEFMQKIIGVKC